jgi:CBS domain-containing protein/mannitol/fructose-specific phosphotransferase system IIA component (Ntr-type)
VPSRVRLADYLQPAHIAVPLNATTLKQAVHEMLQRLSQHRAINDMAEVEELLERSRPRDVVSVGRGVVLPHFRTEAVNGVVVSLGVAKQALDASGSGIDSAPRVVVLILAPPSAATLYLQTVAALARLLSDEDVVRSITNARSAQEIAQLPQLQTLYIEPQLRVRDVMSRAVTTIGPAAPIRSVVDLMVERKVRAVVVVSENQQVLGILTEWDVMRAMVPHIPRVGEETEEEEAADMTVRDVMTRSVLCVDEEMGLPEAVNLMINKNAEQCPVVDDGQLVGILLRSEIIRKLFAR